MLKYAWIGSAAVETSVLALRADLPYKTFDDLKKAKEINIGATGPVTPHTISDPHQAVSGYQSETHNRVCCNADILLATERKEWMATRAPTVRSGHISQEVCCVQSFAKIPARGLKNCRPWRTLRQIKREDHPRDVHCIGPGWPALRCPPWNLR